MKTTIFFNISTFFSLLSIYILLFTKCNILGVTFLVIGGFLLGVGVGGAIANSIWKKLFDMIEVLKLLTK